MATLTSFPLWITISLAAKASLSLLQSMCSSIFIDKPTRSALRALNRAGVSAGEVFYFDDSSDRLASLAQERHNRTLSPVDVQVGNLFTKTGGWIYRECALAAVETARELAHDLVSNAPLLCSFAKKWRPEYLELHFRRYFEPKIRHSYLMIAVASWMSQKSSSTTDVQTRLFIRRAPWTKSLERFAQTKGVKLEIYREVDFEKFIRLVRMPLALLYGVIQNIVSKHQPANNERQAIAIHYSRRIVVFSNSPPCVWLPPDIDAPLVVFDINEGAYPENPAQQCSSLSDVTLYGYARHNKYYCSFRSLFIFLPSMTSIVFSLPSSFLHSPDLTLLLAEQCVELSLDLSRWMDCFRRHKVKLMITTMGASMAQTEALHRLGGISLSGQFSISNICWPTSSLTAGEYVQLVFSQRFLPIWRQSGAIPHFYCQVGTSSETLNALHEELLNIKTRFRENGVKFTLCFFDENTSDAWSSAFPNSDARADYGFLLAWLLVDFELGLIAKPKHGHSLKERIGKTSDLFPTVEQTGRFALLEDGQFSPSFSPADVAKVSDIAVGKLVGGTACWEAYCAGTRSAMLAGPSDQDHPFREQAEGTVVFGNWEHLRKAVDNYRRDPATEPALGDWSAFEASIDPYLDGRGPERIRSFVELLYKYINNENTSQETLDETSKQFQELWPDSILQHKGQFGYTDL